MDKYSLRRDVAESALADLRSFKGSDCYMAAMKLFSALDDLYGEELKSVSDTDLKRKQGAALQCSALVKAMLDEGGALPKI